MSHGNHAPTWHQLSPLSRLLNVLAPAVAAGGVTATWLLGPNPHALAFVMAALSRRLPVALGVRSDLSAVVAARYETRPGFRAAALALEAAWRGLARRLPCVVVGAGLRDQYRSSRALHVLTVSLVRDEDITAGRAPCSESGLELLSVGRLEREKDPLPLVDVLAHLRRDGTPWTLRICGEGHLRRALERRLQDYGLAAAVSFEGYVPFGPELLDRYRRSDALLVTSRAEGVPQTILEALASGLPVVASDVGGIGAQFGEHVSIVRQRDAPRMAAAIASLRSDPGTRQRMADAGRSAMRSRTLEAEARRLGEFLATATAK
jgi:glycosyltransferase involved in cell wall biosynthesis